MSANRNRCSKCEICGREVAGNSVLRCACQDCYETRADEVRAFLGFDAYARHNPKVKQYKHGEVARKWNALRDG